MMQNDPLYRAVTSHGTIAILGMGKNAGKTTVLGHMLRLLAKAGRVAGLTSIGRDGEARDIVTGTAKPAIWVRDGTLLATAAEMLRLGDITPEIVGTTGIHTPLGEVVLVRALIGGTVQLAGPSMREQLAQVSTSMHALGADTVLIDGAIHRRALGAPSVSEAVVLCAGASQSADMRAVIEETAYICRLLMLPTCDAQTDARIEIAGALTDEGLSALPIREGVEVVVEDASRILLSRRSFERLTARGARLTVRSATRLCCVCVNPYAVSGPGFDGDAFRAGMAAAVPVPVLDVKGAMYDD